MNSSLALGSPTSAVFNAPSSRPQTAQHMSPNHSLPTGMANLEKSEMIPEIQMPSMASFDPFSRGAQQSYYTSTPCRIQR